MSVAHALLCIFLLHASSLENDRAVDVLKFKLIKLAPEFHDSSWASVNKKHVDLVCNSFSMILCDLTLFLFCFILSQ